MISLSRQVINKIFHEWSILKDFSNSDIIATLVLIFPDHKTFMKDHNRLAGPIIDSFKEQGLKIELNDGEVLGATAVSSNFIKTLTKEATFYKND